MYKLLIVEDEPLTKYGIKTTIPWADYYITICGEASNGIEGFELAKTLLPDIILTDVKMPLLDGLGMIKKLKEAQIESEVIILSGYGEFEFAKVALEHSVNNYLLKPVSNEELIDTVLKVIEKIKDKDKQKKSSFIVENSKEEIKRKVIRFLVREYYTSLEDLTNQLAMFSVPFINEGYFIVGVLDEPQEASLNNDKLAVFEEELSKVLLQENITFISGIYHEKVCFYIETKDINTLEKNLELSLDNFARLDEATLSLGISSYIDNILQVHRGYEEAKGVAINGLIRFVNSLQRYNGTSIIFSPNLLRALSIINQEYNKNLSVNYISEKLKVSDSYVMHMFKNELGTTFIKILIKTRLREAIKLIKSGSYSIKEIAYKVGFNDEKYFSMVFKKYMNTTPSEYSKRT